MPPKKPRGELAELQVSLQSLCTSHGRSPSELQTAKRDTFRKITSLVSVGMDMSSLFPSMISVANLSSDDLVLKKLLYFYITYYATSIPDLALLAINQLHKDCQERDPTVRGLALRSLCSLRVPNFVEYVTQPIDKGLEDKNPYVRRTAVMGVLKLYHIDPQVVTIQGLMERVRRMIHVDPDPQVMERVLSNCLTVLMQVEDFASLASDKALIYSLVNRIKEFTDWAQCQVMELCSHYVPGSEGEVYDFLNALEDRMSHSSSAVVMAVVKLFLLMTLQMPATHQQVLERIKDPLKSLISREEPSTKYAVLSHALLLLQRAPILFEQDHATFYCRANDPWFIKKLKMESLAAIATPLNAYDIVNELTEYARDISPSMGREAVKAIGQIALSVPDVGGIIERLLTFLDVGGPEHLIAEALVQMKDLLRRYPDLALACLPQLNELNPAIVQLPEARAALVWILGQFGEHIQPAPYLLEAFCTLSLASNEEGGAINLTMVHETPIVRLALLTATARLFFKRPPECQPLLGALLTCGLNDSHQDVHDRALLYYRLLKSDPGEAARVICPPLIEVKSFSEAMSDEVKEKVFAEFNSLSVLFQAPSATFVEKKSYFSEIDDEARTTNVKGAGRSGGLEGEGGGAGGGGATSSATTIDLFGDEMYDASASLLGGDVGGTREEGPGALGGALVGVGALGGGGGGGLDLSSLLSLSSFPAPLAPTTSGTPATSVTPASLASLYSQQASQQQQQLPEDFFSLGETSTGGGGGGWGQGGGGWGAVSAPAPAPAAPYQASAPPTNVTMQLKLNPNARLTSPQFQAQWQALPPVHQYEEKADLASIQSMASNERDKAFSQHLAQAGIQTMASGGQAPVFKFYLYGQVVGTNALILIELVARSDTSRLQVTIKTEAIELLPQFVELWTMLIVGF